MATRRIVTTSLIVLAVLACLTVAGVEGWMPLGHSHPVAQTAPSASHQGAPNAPSAQPSAASTSSPAAGSYTYSTPQPGPGCDKNGATWSENNVQFSNGGCDVEATVASQYGFLNVTLPGGQAFAQDNTVSVTGSLGNSGSGYDSACLGLEENAGAFKVADLTVTSFEPARGPTP